VSQDLFNLFQQRCSCEYTRRRSTTVIFKYS